MSIESGRAQLESARQDLNVRWQRVTMYWNDRVTRDFENAHLDPLDRKVKAALVAVDEINALIHRARRECG